MEWAVYFVADHFSFPIYVYHVPRKILGIVLWEDAKETSDEPNELNTKTRNDIKQNFFKIYVPFV